MVVMNEVACDPGMKMTIPEYIVPLPCLFSSDCDITSLTQIPIYTICDGDTQFQVTENLSDLQNFTFKNWLYWCL